MTTDVRAAAAAAADRKALYRAGGISAIALGLCYFVITGLYAAAGAVPGGGGEAWLDYLDGRTAEWWWIAGLSVFTDALFLPLSVALYGALKTVSRLGMLAGVALLGLFVVLDLAVTWPNYASLITLSGDYAAAMDDARRAATVAAATYPASVLGSRLFAVYAILVPALGILAIGLVMLEGSFSRSAGYVGTLTGILGSVSVVGPLLWNPLGVLAIPTSVLTTVWVLIVGYRLLEEAGRDDTHPRGRIP